MLPTCYLPCPYYKFNAALEASLTCGARAFCSVKQARTKLASPPGLGALALRAVLTVQSQELWGSGPGAERVRSGAMVLGASCSVRSCRVLLSCDSVPLPIGCTALTLHRRVVSCEGRRGRSLQRVPVLLQHIQNPPSRHRSPGMCSIYCVIRFVFLATTIHLLVSN